MTQLSVEVGGSLATDGVGMVPPFLIALFAFETQLVANLYRVDLHPL